MKLRMFSVVGEALNFGLRRMETIMRVAWLPVVLMLIFNMASVFAVLSIANNRFITFADLAHGVSYQRAIMVSQQALWNGLAQMSVPIWTVFIATLIVSAILLASFMAPLIRLAGLGEKPAPGVVRLPFGPDQIRYVIASFLVTLVFIYAPIGAAAYWVLKYVLDAFAQVYVAFPNPDSLHTIELVSAHDALAGRGELWGYIHGAPLAAATALALIFWGVQIAHFHPDNRAEPDRPPNFMARAFFTLLVFGLLGGLIWFGIRDAEDASTASLAALYAVSILIALYLSVRVFPYAGIAVCRRSLAPAGLLRVTRGWNILRLLVITVLISLTIFIVQYLVNVFVFGAISVRSVVSILFQATTTATKLTNSGEVAPWVLPVFVSIWNAIKILINIFFLFFSNGVWAGLQGRLYRESEA